MCISISAQPASVPYNDSKVRWKVLKLIISDGRVYIRSAVMECKWNIGTEKRAKPAELYADYKDIGIHVFVNRWDACRDVMHTRSFESFCKDARGGRIEYSRIYVIAKMEVRSHKFSGTWCSTGCRNVQSETWRYAKLVSLYDIDGNLITKKVKRLVARKPR